MTPEEIQRTIEGMLQVQRELQESQIRLQQELLSLAELSRSGERKLERLIGSGNSPPACSGVVHLATLLPRKAIF